MRLLFTLTDKQRVKSNEDGVATYESGKSDDGRKQE